MTTPYVALLLYTHFGVTGVLAMVGGVLLLMSVAILALRIETSQQTLEEISPDTEMYGAGGAEVATGSVTRQSAGV
jgi:putative MFS transporter